MTFWPFATTKKEGVAPIRLKAQGRLGSGFREPLEQNNQNKTPKNMARKQTSDAFFSTVELPQRQTTIAMAGWAFRKVNAKARLWGEKIGLCGGKIAKKTRDSSRLGTYQD